MPDWYAPIFTLYEQYQAADSDIHEHLPRLKAFVDIMRPLNILECGVRTGHSTLAFLAGLGNLPASHLYSVDITPVQDQVGEWVNRIPQWIFKMRNDVPYPDWMPPNAEIIFIDTEHSYLQTALEIREYAPHLAPNGVMLFHDTDESGGFGVKRACYDYRREAKFLFYEWPTNNGLGVMYRESEKEKIEKIIEQVNFFVPEHNNG